MHLISFIIIVITDIIFFLIYFTFCFYFLLYSNIILIRCSFYEIILFITSLTFKATHGSNGTKSFLKCLTLLYYRHLNNKTSFLSLHMVINHEITILDFS